MNADTMNCLVISKKVADLLIKPVIQGPKIGPIRDASPYRCLGLKSSALPQQLFDLTLGEIAPVAGFKPTELNMHDPNALQAPHLVAEHRTHTTDLPVKALRQDNAENVWR